MSGAGCVPTRRLPFVVQLALSLSKQGGPQEGIRTHTGAWMRVHTKWNLCLKYLSCRQMMNQIHPRASTTFSKKVKISEILKCHRAACKQQFPGV